MAEIYDTGDITLSEGGADIAQNHWSDLEQVDINDYGAKIVTIVLEFVNAAACSGNLYIFSEVNGSWSTATASQDPMNTTSQLYKSASITALYTIITDTIYFANNDTTVSNNLYIAYYNTNADTCLVKVRIIYDSLSVG